MILFVLLAAFFYFQFEKINWDIQNIYLERPLILIVVLLLVPLNWFFEWKKWTSTLSVLELSSIGLEVKRNAFFAGIISGMLTPNMLGNFIGRIFYFERKHRTSLIILTLVSNYAQFISSIVFGIFAIIILNNTPLDFEVSNLKILLLFVTLFVVILYFNFEWFFKFIKRKTRIHTMIRNLKKRRSFRWKILILSVSRHIIFTLQFLLMLYAFGEDFSLQNIFWIWQVYLWVTLAPSLFMGKLAIRESISIWVLGFVGMGELTILVSSFMIWTLNLLLPTIIGLVIIKSKK